MVSFSYVIIVSMPATVVFLRPNQKNENSEFEFNHRERGSNKINMSFSNKDICDYGVLCMIVLISNEHEVRVNH